MGENAAATRNVKEVLKDWVPHDLAHEVKFAVKGKRPHRQDSAEILESISGVEIDDGKLVDDAVEISVTALSGAATGEAKDDSGHGSSSGSGSRAPHMTTRDGDDDYDSDEKPAVV